LFVDKNNNNDDDIDIFDDDRICRWPLAEVCLSTCGQCPLVEAARKCQSLPEEIDDRLRYDEYIDWEAFFEGITSGGNANNNDNNNNTHPHYLQGARILNRESPWVAEFPNYLTEEEADELIRIASVEGYRIEDEHPKHIRDVNVTNCDSIQCMRQPIVTELYRRVSELMGFHPNNFESMEFIDYSVGQHYSWHADEYSWKEPVIRDPLAVLAGPRLLTMFHYLSGVDEGGETAFAGPDATGRTKRLTVTPKKGKVILWANMKPEWRFSDPAAVHSAMPVRKGRKLAGTLWIHASGFRVPELYAGKDCHPRTFYEEQYRKSQEGK
jgi:prolyl 4-hydroxylase